VDIVMPQTAAGMEPLCAVYSRRCLNPARRHLEQNEFKVQRAFARCRIKKIAEQSLRTVDPQLVSFFNINTPEDLRRAEEIAAGRTPAQGLPEC